MLLEKAVLRRLILPAVLRQLFLTGSALKPVVPARCEEIVCILSLICFKRRARSYCVSFTFERKGNETEPEGTRKCS